MKKTPNLLFVSALVFSLAGCGDKPGKVALNGTEEIILDDVTYYNTGKVADTEPEESNIEVMITSGETNVINAYAMIKDEKTVYCRIEEEWYVFTAEPEE